MIAKIIDCKTIEVYDLSQFDIDAIMHSGQVFRYFEAPNGYQLVVGNNYADIERSDNKTIIRSSNSAFFYNYFDLNTDYNEIKKELHQYESIRSAIEAGGGIRILRSEFNEMVISFIISANNNIKRFTKTLNALAEQFGDKLPNNLYSFPTLKQLSLVSESDFNRLGCGYRSAYLVKAVKQLQELDITALKKLTLKEQDKLLQTITGIGPKVSACVRLFADPIHDLSVCPIDVWLQKALNTLNACDRDVLLNHPYAGVAQQYIFYYLQHLHKEL